MVWDQYQRPGIDKNTHALEEIDLAHSKIHDGDHYFCSKYEDLADTEVLDMVVVTPNSEIWNHMLFFIQGQMATLSQLYEDSSHTAATGMTAQNNNRNSGNAAGLAVSETTADGADGNLIYETKFGASTGAGANAHKAGGEARGDSEIILKANSTYYLKNTSQADGNTVEILLEWYENKNIP